MKAIIQRNLPLNTQYTLIDKVYIPIEYSTCCCNNCGKPISNIATIQSETGRFNVGFDCLDTILLNNDLLTNKSDYEKVKKMIPKIIRFAKIIKEQKTPITGLRFEKSTFSDWITFYWLQNNQTTSRDNDGVKIKDMDFDFFIATLKNIFPKLTIIA